MVAVFQASGALVCADWYLLTGRNVRGKRESARILSAVKTDIWLCRLKQFGKIAFVRKRRARAVTGYGTVGADGTLFNSFKVRVVSRLKGIGGLFTQKKEYKDEESNLVKKK